MAKLLIGITLSCRRIYICSVICFFERIFYRNMRNHSCILRLLLIFCIWTCSSFPLLSSWLCWLRNKHSCPFALSSQNLLIEDSRLWGRMNCSREWLKKFNYVDIINNSGKIAHRGKRLKKFKHERKTFRACLDSTIDSKATINVGEKLL